MYTLKAADLNNVKIEGSFWQRLHTIVKDKMVPFQWKALNDELPNADPSHAIKNFKIAAGEIKGEYYGFVFQDSDIGKWLEEVAYTLASYPDKQLEALMDDVIDLLGRAQQEDGYLNTYYTVKEPGKRWTNFKDNHELYCAGHLMEAAVAVYNATGKRKFLDIMLKYAAYINSVIGPKEEGKIPGYPGHPEIELALMRMYEVTGEEWLYKLAKYFIDVRGTEPDYYVEEQEKYHNHYDDNEHTFSNKKYHQRHLPVRQQTTVEGHSVRALYLLSGMVDVAVKSGDKQLMDACDALFDNAVNKRMYVTGGVGSTHIGEAFTLDYDLPNDTVYAETCASIALIFAADRLNRNSPKGMYGDVIERALYNTCLAGMSLDGQGFFYVNPLEVNPKKSFSDPGKRHVRTTRPQWFPCACCPPNLARLLASIGQYVYAASNNCVYINQFVESTAKLSVGGKEITVSQKTDYPYDGKICVYPGSGSYEIKLRVPAWSEKYTLKLNGKALDVNLSDGFVAINKNWQAGDEIVLELDMSVNRVYANLHVSEDVGKVALQRGPLVYCAEEIDNGPELCNIVIPEDAKFTVEERGDIGAGILGLTVNAQKYTNEGPALYSLNKKPNKAPFTLRLIPYYAWANRQEGEMLVWFNE